MTTQANKGSAPTGNTTSSAPTQKAAQSGLFDSKSLWNYSLSPGWTQEEVTVLKIALMKFGIGKWTKIEKSGVLPTKSIQQCYLQTQRLLGQQSLAEYMGLSVDIDRIYKDNCAKQGIRKCGFLVNQGGKLLPEEKQRLIAVNRTRYGLTEDEVENLKLPTAQHLVEIYSIDKITNPKSRMGVVEKLNHLIKLQAALENKLSLIRSGVITSKTANQSRLPSRPVGKVRVVGQTETQQNDFKFLSSDNEEISEPTPVPGVTAQDVFKVPDTPQAPRTSRHSAQAPQPQTPIAPQPLKVQEKKPRESKSPGRKSAERKSTEKKSVEKKPREKKTVEKMSVERKSRERKSVEKKPRESKSPGRKSVERKSRETKSPGRKSVERKPRETKSPGRKSAERKSPGRKSVERKSKEKKPAEEKQQSIKMPRQPSQPTPQPLIAPPEKTQTDLPSTPKRRGRPPRVKTTDESPKTPVIQQQNPPNQQPPPHVFQQPQPDPRVVYVGPPVIQRPAQEEPERTQVILVPPPYFPPMPQPAQKPLPAYMTRTMDEIIRMNPCLKRPTHIPPSLSSDSELSNTYIGGYTSAPHTYDQQSDSSYTYQQHTYQYNPHASSGLYTSSDSIITPGKSDQSSDDQIMHDATCNTNTANRGGAGAAGPGSVRGGRGRGAGNAGAGRVVCNAGAGRRDTDEVEFESAEQMERLMGNKKKRSK
ncbi:hypothetical protein FGO68_gene14884 [Halteria grandinella]|uniref:Myb-like domain-containing protein n=1 Tax=Halteria grandinella TaxID=5974 RepID=A0A8J8NV78_HALGN|nr:hypothetical protein FGO68_gene14884 [Halteria grandinella]